MIEISLTRFLDFTVKSGAPKLTSLRQTKQQLVKGYNPATDYYKKIRDAIVSFHRNGKLFSTIDAVAANVSEKSKKENYPLVAAGYRTFLGTKQISWFSPPQSDWSAHGVSVSINPELGLEFGGERHVIKLYFKDDKPRKTEVLGVLTLMNTSLQGGAQPVLMSLLDVRRGKLFSSKTPNSGILSLMEGEAAAIAAIWRTL